MAQHEEADKYFHKHKEEKNFPYNKLLMEGNYAL